MAEFRRSKQTRRTIQSKSIRGMLDLIANREAVRKRGRTIAWTYNPNGDLGRIDTETADKIAHRYGDEIKSRWDDPRYDSTPFVEKMLLDYPALRQYWDELRAKEDS